MLPKLVKIGNEQPKVKFTAYGKIDCAIKATKKENGLTEIIVNILDTGVGISTDKKLNVFNSFGQMRLNDKRSFGGVGLGLSIVKLLIDLFGGTITIDSNEGRGTNVSMKMEFKIIEQVNTKFKDSIAGVDINALKVFVVEDNLMHQIIMRIMLNNLSITYYKLAANGKEALYLLENNAFDIILMDLQMPIMDGYETTVIIRNNPPGNINKNIPIIAVTADATDTARQKVMDVGMNDYITKPVNRELLSRKINEHNKNVLKIA